MVLNPGNAADQVEELRRYRLFGHTFASNRPLASWLPPSPDPADLVISFVSEPPVDWDPADATPVFSSRSKSEDGRSILVLYILGACKVIRFLEFADFYLWPDRLVCRVDDRAPAHLIRNFLLANVLPFWLELKGFITIHGSAVNISGQAVAFLAHSHNGKSTLAASLLQSGYALLTDDVLPLRVQDGIYWAYPGYPAMRMWPDEADHFLTEYEHLERVHPDLDKRYVPVGNGYFGLFCDQPVPLGRIYILERRGADDLQAEPEIQHIPHREALIELLRYSFITRLSEAVGLAGDRFGSLSGLVRVIPVRRLIYPSGYEQTAAGPSHDPRRSQRLNQAISGLGARARPTAGRVESCASQTCSGLLG